MNGLRPLAIYRRRPATCLAHSLRCSPFQGLLKSVNQLDSGKKSSGFEEVLIHFQGLDGVRTRGSNRLEADS